MKKERLSKPIHPYLPAKPEEKNYLEPDYKSESKYVSTHSCVSLKDLCADLNMDDNPVLTINNDEDALIYYKSKINKSAFKAANKYYEASLKRYNKEMKEYPEKLRLFLEQERLDSIALLTAELNRLKKFNKNTQISKLEKELETIKKETNEKATG